MNRKEKLIWYKNEFDKISNEIKDKKHLTHNDFLRIRNFKLRNLTIEKEEHVNKITSDAFTLAEKDKIKEAITKLLELDGVAIPIASTILAMRFPDKYAIIDTRVIRCLRKEEWLKNYTKNPQIYEDYILLLRRNKPSHMTLRDYERNLFEGNINN
ncbi:MAG: hypothetical protein RL557_638 [archaeon]|jgi:endonuclease III